ncbi:MAG: hypothetical protein MUF15_09490 [Acidobacteria bacterium]|jgi:hypothetical protein|nr:hypothetical protein [Acidobacteriota bacterium]
MEQTKALIIFCEGKHDVAFCRLIFKHFLGTTENKELKFSHYPSPFHRLFKTSIEKHFVGDMSLDMAHKFFLPDSTYIKNDWLFLLFDTGGKSKRENPHHFLYDFVDLMENENASVFQEGAPSFINDVKYLFLFDADHKRPEDIFTEFEKNYWEIKKSEKEKRIWLKDKLTRDEKNAFFAVSNDKAVYVWADPVNHTGTLEEYLLPLFETDQKELAEKATLFIDSTFPWETDHKKNDKSIAEIAKRKKAIITALGQRKKPGCSMNVILDQSELLSADTLWKSEAVRNFAEFVATFTGIEFPCVS